VFRTKNSVYSTRVSSCGNACIRGGTQISESLSTE